MAPGGATAPASGDAHAMSDFTGSQVAIVVGSLRRASFNHSVALALVELAPQSLACEFIGIGALPLCNQDDDDNSPAASRAFRAQVLACDAVLFVTPEYNRSIPAPLKNALDVGSRPYGHSVWNGKPAAVASASPGAMGGFGASQHLRQALAGLNMPVMPQPDLYIDHVDRLIDADGKIADEPVRVALASFMRAFAIWIAHNPPR